MPLLTVDVEPLWIARYDYEPHWHLPRHAHEGFFQLILIVSGTGTAWLGPDRHPFQAGQLLFLRPGLAHGLTAGAKEPVRTLDTKFYVHRARLRSACRRLPAFHPRVDDDVAALLEATLAEARRSGPLRHELCQTLFTQLLLRLLRPESRREPARLRSALPAPEEDLVHRLERHLRENCAGPISQRSLSAAFHYSYRHLHHTWLQHHRESPLQALWRFRIDRATQLIRYSDYELKRIAELSGFASVHHFTRVFSRITGVPPARWRARELAGVRQDIALRRGFVNRVLTIQHDGSPPDPAPPR